MLGIQPVVQERGLLAELDHLGLGVALCQPELRVGQPRREPGGFPRFDSALASHAGDASRSPTRAEQGHVARTGSLGDRKSTRLNSSHLVISYAVFCLKKK